MKYVNSLIGIVLFAAFLYVFAPTLNKEFNPTDQYCDMWEIWHNSDGEYGWPDPENVYYKECVK